MFKSWRKKSSAKPEGTESKRFSLLGSKKHRSPETNSAPNIQTYTFPSKSDEQPRDSAPNTFHSNASRSDSFAATKSTSGQYITIAHIQNATEADAPLVTKRETYISKPNGTSYTPQLETQEQNFVPLNSHDCTAATEQSLSTLRCSEPPQEVVTVGLEQEDMPAESNDDIQSTTVTSTSNHSRPEVTVRPPDEPDGGKMADHQQIDEAVERIDQLGWQVQKLQLQVKDIRQYFKGLLQRDTEGLIIASTRIQALARGHLARKRHHNHRFVKLRGYHITKRPMSLNQLHKECALIGTTYRGPQSDELHTKQDLAVSNIQKIWRGRMVRQRIRKYKNEKIAATRIQALWRGYRTREANPRILVKILQRRAQEQQRSIERLTQQVRKLQDQMSEETEIQQLHADSLNQLHAEVRVIRSETIAVTKKPTVVMRKSRQFTEPPAIDISKFALLEDYTYLKAEIEYLHQRMNEIHMEKYMCEDTSR
ncbi:hypothetical protein K493DRAFT_296438 [Basidiobolus meristosporus CBS 931.73]|uniref:Uncharacterized protein n=1 Tax=Basidiobolus meristosporus CBS 931.73 TaxID=1314790 RepID=A0A1Y1Z5X4_9FUNG|nr:hypothetical protein K493DRAFT_296438 [Basidiobolus meristosporus CBS 931.73]|eukprot:ORY05524.1 hypothetical protein K493DRAFT_296438 [Basidiobolus meristosporus CBS 931.73]